MTEKEYLLVVLAEEGSEVAQAAIKAMRFGMDKFHPESDESNREHLAREVAEVIAIAEKLGLKIKDSHIREKIEKLEHYMDVSRECGTLDEPTES